MNPEFTSLVDMEELQVALETVTADLSLLKEYVDPRTSFPCNPMLSDPNSAIISAEPVVVASVFLLC